MNKAKRKLFLVVLICLIFSTMLFGNALADQKAFTATISPDKVAPIVSSAFTLVIKNDPSTSAGNKLGSAIISIQGFTIPDQTVVAKTSSGKTWSSSVKDNQILITAPKATDSISPTQTITVTFQATSPSAGGSYSVAIIAYTKPIFSGDLFNPFNLPSVLVQYKVTFASNSLSDAVGNLATYSVSGGSSGSIGIGGGSILVNPGAVLSYEFVTPIYSSTSGKRYVLVDPFPTPATGFTVSSSITLSGKYQAQVQLTVNSAYDSPSPSGSGNWYNIGDLITASVTTPTVDDGSGTRYRCTGWTGTGSVDESGIDATTTFNINLPSTITWNWLAQYKLTLATNPASVGATNIAVSPSSVDGFYDKGTTVTLTATSPVSIAQESGGPLIYVFSGWSVGTTTSSANPITYTINSPTSITANYGSGFQLTLPPGASAEVSSTENLNIGLPGHIGAYFTVKVVTFSEGTSTIAFHISLDDLTAEQIQNYQNLKIFMTDPVDFTGDNSVNGNDVNEITKVIQDIKNGVPLTEALLGTYDINHDGNIDEKDLNIVKEYANSGIVVPTPSGGQWRLPWLDITTSVEISGNEIIIYGATDHFSGFGVR